MAAVKPPPVSFLKRASAFATAAASAGSKRFQVAIGLIPLAGKDARPSIVTPSATGLRLGAAPTFASRSDA
jgi:hypothetical protein